MHRRIFAPKNEGITGKLYNEELHNFLTSNKSTEWDRKDMREG
jgi:hypothetical protein